MRAIRHPKDFFAGLMFIGFGAAAVLLSFDYTLGTAARGDPSVFLARPISLVMLSLAAILLLLIVVPAVRKKREEAFQE